MRKTPDRGGLTHGPPGGPAVAPVPAGDTIPPPSPTKPPAPAMSPWHKRLVFAGVVAALLLLAGWLVAGRVRAWSHYREAEAALARRDFLAARERLRLCLDYAPADPDYLLLAAQSARRDGDLAFAGRLLDRAHAARADRDAVGMERWLWRLQSGDLADAERAYTVCVDKADLPDADLLLEALTVGSLRALHLSLARACIGLWLGRERGTPARVQGLVWRGQEAVRRGAHEQALADYRAALELDPGSEVARRHVAEILVRNDPREALGHLGQLRERRPDDPELRLLLASCRRNLGDHDDARRLLDGLIEEAPDDVPALVERGQVELDLRRTDEAERWFLRAEKAAPGQREPNLALARCLQAAGKEEEAKKYRDRVADIDAELQKRIDKLFKPPAK